MQLATDGGGSDGGEGTLTQRRPAQRPHCAATILSRLLHGTLT
jgi:hypothetical protein